MDPALHAALPRVRALVREGLGPDANVVALSALHGGACQDNVRVDVATPDGPHRLVIRSDAPSSIPGTLDRAAEFAVIDAAVAAGVRTPAARWLTRGLLREGAFAYILDWCEGVAIGRKVLKSPELAAARAGLAAEVAEQAARIHAITPARTTLPLPLPADQDPVEDALRLARDLLDRLPAPRPASELVLRWLRRSAPRDRALTLVHGDLRTGNLMVAPEGLAGVLDWEFARWSSPYEDLAWISVRDWRFGRLDLPVGGFSTRAPFLAAYEAAGGRAVDLPTLHWWEVQGNLRWAVGCCLQAERYAAGQRDLELLAIGRRAVEMEYEALRLIETGVAGLGG